MKLFRNLSRILVGSVFVFSGFVKGIDPLGFNYRLEDYFQVFGMPWALPYTLSLGIFLCVAEFTIGICLLLNLRIKRSAWALLAMMIFFTVLTFFDMVYNMVPDCGCFGDAIKLTNTQTFLKNIVLLIFVVPVFAQRKKFRSWAPGWAQNVFILLFTCAFTGLSVYDYRHLPVIDFMPWKTGNKVNIPATPLKFYITFQNKQTGEQKEFVSPDYPWKDSVWMSKWTFVKQRSADQGKEQSLALRIEDSRGSDVSSSVIDNPDLQFILVAYDLSKTNLIAFNRILPLYKKASQDGYSFVCLTSTPYPEINKFRMTNGTSFPFYNGDDIILKTMVRSNPGLILIRNGIVLAKWGFRDFPDYPSVIGKFRIP